MVKLYGKYQTPLQRRAVTEPPFPILLMSNNMVVVYVCIIFTACPWFCADGQLVSYQLFRSPSAHVVVIIFHNAAVKNDTQVYYYSRRVQVVRVLGSTT